MTRSAGFRLAAGLAALTLVAAVAPAQVDTGTADFTTYVALGDSLTHAVVSASIGVKGQGFSYPSLVHRQATGGAGGFEQPLVSEPGIPGRLVLTSLVPLGLGPLPGFGTPVNLNLPRPYNNLGVSGFDTLDVLLVAGSPQDTVPAQLVLRNLGPAIAQASALQPTFVTLWIGNNDALGAALSGLVVEDVTLTSTVVFRTAYSRVLRGLSALGADLLVATIPDVTVIPFVSTLPPVIVDAAGQPVLVDGAAVPLTGTRGDGSVGPLGAGDFVLLSAAATGALARGDGVPVALGGSGRPLGDALVLDAQEVAAISTRIDEFNQIIRDEAELFGARVIDAHAIFDRIAAHGVLIGGIEFDASLLGGIFSFDGVHPSPLGYGIIANEFLGAINREFGAAIPPANLFSLVAGPDGNLGAPVGLALSTANLQLKNKGWHNLRRLLDIPTTQRIRRLERRLRSAPAGEPAGDSFVTPGAGGRKVVGQRSVGQRRVDRRGVERR